MQNPDTLLTAVCTAIASIPSITDRSVSGIDGPSSIIPYYVDGPMGKSNIEQTIISQPPATMLIYWKGTITGVFNKTDTIKHHFGISLKPAGRVATIFTLIREGVCATSNMKFKLTQVDPSVRPPEEFECLNRTVFISQQYGLRDFSDITFTLTERGIDG